MADYENKTSSSHNPRIMKMRNRENKILIFRFEILNWVPCQKAESLIHTSVGQGTESRSPTKGDIKVSRLKALHIVTNLIMYKAFSLDVVVRSIRRALPYANMSKAFSLALYLSPMTSYL